MSRSPDLITETAAADPPVDLSDLQRRAILTAACHRLRAAVSATACRWPDATLAGAAELPVHGAYVSLKRKGRLRSCCGFVGRATTIDQAIEHAALAAATRDTRQPPISLTELPFLDVEVWLLGPSEPIAARGEQRAAEVAIGRHGLVIAQGKTRGLLLPGVATELGLNAEKFLEHVSLKAGLPPTAWRDDAAQLSRFSGLSFGGRFVDSSLGSLPATAAPLSAADTARLARFCHDNLQMLLAGQLPNCYLLDCPDTTVQAITLSAYSAKFDQPWHNVRISLRPGLPLQATLFEMTQSLARRLKSRSTLPADWRLELAVFWDPAMHGTVAEPDLRGIDSGRAIWVTEGPKIAWCAGETADGEETLRRAAQLARVRMPESAAVYSLQTMTTGATASGFSRPQPVHGPAVRPAAVAGTFYPGDADELTALVDELLPQGEVEKQRWPAAMVPHAGLRFSGAIAAKVLRRIEIPETVIVIGPKHTRFGVGWAVAPHETWSLPGGSLPADRRLAEQLAEVIDELELDALAHRHEHAIEVELPLLARLAPRSRVVGIAIGSGNLDLCREFAAGLAEVVGQRDDVLLLISSDMNHFATDAENRRLDQIALTALGRLDPEYAYRTIRENHISMCGLLPAVIVMETLSRLGKLNRCDRVAYGTSAEVSGDTRRVVGYAGMLFG